MYQRLQGLKKNRGSLSCKRTGKKRCFLAECVRTILSVRGCGGGGGGGGVGGVLGGGGGGVGGYVRGSSASGRIFLSREKRFLGRQSGRREIRDEKKRVEAGRARLRGKTGIRGNGNAR